jgi:hypothetical protein
LLIYQVEVHIYIGFHALKVKCTQYGNCSQAAFKNTRAIFFSNGRGGQQFLVGLKIFPGGCPHPDLTPSIVRRGGLNVYRGWVHMMQHYPIPWLHYVGSLCIWWAFFPLMLGVHVYGEHLCKWTMRTNRSLQLHRFILRNN